MAVGKSMIGCIGSTALLFLAPTGEVVVTASVKGTAFDGGNATLEAADIAEKFWTLYSERTPTSVTI